MSSKVCEHGELFVKLGNGAGQLADPADHATRDPNPY
jgi:hypothetical protein